MHATLVDVGTPRVVGEHDGGLLLVAGSERIVLIGDAVDVAAPAFASRISRATRCAEGWSFFTEDGLVAYAAAFLGTPRRISAVRQDRAPREIAPDGTLAFVDREGAIRVGRCDGDVRTIRALGEPVLDAAFANAREGLAILLGGRLVSTRDGGERWEPVSTGNRPAIAVELDGGALRVSASEWHVWRGGTLVQQAESAVAPEHRELSAEERRRVLEELWRVRAPALGALDAVSDSVVQLEGGAWVGFNRGVLSSPDGRRWDRVEDTLQERSCTFRPWGAEVVAQCERGADSEPIREKHYFRSEDGWSFRPLELPRGVAWRGVSFSDDARHVVLSAPCIPDPGDRDEHIRGICLVDTQSGQTFETRWDDIGRSVGWHEHYGLYSRERGTGEDDDDRFYLVDGRRSDIRPIRIDRVEIEEVSWTRSGLVFGTGKAREDRERHALFSWNHETGAAAVELLPEGATGAGAFDDERMVAVGSSVASAWTSESGGRDWTRLELALDGDATAVRLTSRSPRVSCVHSGCFVPPLWVEWTDEVRAPQSYLVSATRFWSDPWERNDAGPEPRLGSDYTCRRSAELASASAPSSARHPSSAQVGTRGIDLRVHSTQGRVAFEWRSFRRGLERGRASTAFEEVLTPHALATVWPVLATGRGLLAGACVPGLAPFVEGGAPCGFAWLTSRRAAHVSIAWLRGLFGIQLTDALPLPSGELVLHHSGPLMHTIEWLKSDGTVLQRSLGVQEGWRSQLALDGDRPAVLLTNTNGLGAWVLPFADAEVAAAGSVDSVSAGFGSASRAPAEPRFETDLPACAPPQPASGRGVLIRVEPWQDGSALVELRSEGACVSGVLPWTLAAFALPGRYPQPPEAVALEAANGALEGAARTQDGAWYAIRCERHQPFH